VATAADDYSVRLWDTASRRQTHQLTAGIDKVTAVAFSRDGSRLLATAGDTVTVYAMDTVRKLTSFTVASAAFPAAIGPDNRTILVGSPYSVTLYTLAARYATPDGAGASPTHS
jgi:WD40 repeat protein